MSRRQVERTRSGAWDRWFLGREELGNERRINGGPRGTKVLRYLDLAVATDRGKPRTAVRQTKISKKHDHVQSWWFK